MTNHEVTHVITAIEALLDPLVCKAQLPMGTRPAPVEDCECWHCETARALHGVLYTVRAVKPPR